MRYCCEKCFDNKFLVEYIQRVNKKGDCEYCHSNNVSIISTKEVGNYIRKCLDKAYEDIGAGTGAMYDSEEKEYYDGSGKVAIRFSVKEILTENEEIISDSILDSNLLEDIFEDSGLSFEEKKDGEYDKYEDIEGTQLVLKNNLYGEESIQMYHSWELFKHIIKHYNRFFDMEKENLREQYLIQLRPYIMEYEDNIKEGMIFYRARRQDSKLPDFKEINVYKELSPAPPKYASTNRMSPAGISYLYLASDRETAYAECRYKGESVLLAEYEAKKELAIIDFSKEIFLNAKSIFSDEYDHDLWWINNFLSKFVVEITCPVDDKKKDHSYEYASTQLIAEYIRSLGYDGICFKSSVGTGKSFVFFCGPDFECDPDAYEFENEYMKYYFPLLEYFTNWFSIQKLELNYVLEDGINDKILDEREISDLI